MNKFTFKFQKILLQVFFCKINIVFEFLFSLPRKNGAFEIQKYIIKWNPRNGFPTNFQNVFWVRISSIRNFYWDVLVVCDGIWCAERSLRLWRHNCEAALTRICWIANEDVSINDKMYYFIVNYIRNLALDFECIYEINFSSERLISVFIVFRFT